MKYLKYFIESNLDFRQKLESPKILGKIDLPTRKSINQQKSTKMNYVNIKEIPKDFAEEIKIKIDSYFNLNPKIHNSYEYCLERLSKLLDHNKIKIPDTMEKLLKSTKIRNILMGKNFFRFDKKYNCYTNFKVIWENNKVELKTYFVYGPIKGQTKHGDFYFEPFEDKDTKNVVYTQHLLDRYYERKIDSSVKRPNEKQRVDAIKEFLKDWMNSVGCYTLPISENRNYDEEIFVEMSDGGGVVGEKSGNCAIFYTYYDKEMMDDKKRKDKK